jgi:GNAT superfamily N-acetyltransferase
MKLSFAIAIESNAPEIAELRNAVSEHLTRLYSNGPKASKVTEKGVLYDMRTSRVVIARNRTRIIATLRLAAKKPWAIDTAYFTSVKKPLYLTTMAVHPEMQRKGVGTQLMDKARAMAKDWPSDAIRLDAYDTEGGAGAFYAKCGFREVGRATYRKAALVYFELLL